MQTTTSDCWRHATDPVRRKPAASARAVPEEDELTPQQLAEVEHMLELIASAECAMGCDYPEGPIHPSGCSW